MEQMEPAQLISVLTGFVIPLLVGLLSKLNAAKSLKAVLNFGLSALASVLATVIPEQFTWSAFLVTFAMTWVSSVATYYGLWKPTQTAQVIQVKTANMGVGGTKMERTDHAA